MRSPSPASFKFKSTAPPLTRSKRLREDFGSSQTATQFVPDGFNGYELLVAKELWLHPKAEPRDVCGLLAPVPDDVLELGKVSPPVNSVKDDGPSCSRR